MSNQPITPTKVKFNGSVFKDVDTVMSDGHVCELDVPENDHSRDMGIRVYNTSHHVPTSMISGRVNT